MKTVLFTTVLSIGLLAALTAPAQEDAGIFAKWLDRGASGCVPVSAVESVSKVVELTPAQFQFVRALYVALPPISRTLPPGDHAVVAIADGKAMLALVADGQACARFLAPQFVLRMLIQVGESEAAPPGEPI